MGNRTYLTCGACWEFEANNVLPVTWLALVDAAGFRVETRRAEYPSAETPAPGGQPESSWRRLRSLAHRFIGRETPPPPSAAARPGPGPVNYDEYEAAVYQTSQVAALRRVEGAIDRLKGQTPAWPFLRPLEILRDELRRCPPDETVELELTQFWAMDDARRERVRRAATAFGRWLDDVAGDAGDIAALDRLVNDYTLGRVSSVADLHPEDRMFVLLGTYWGEPDREALYSLAHFDAAYWSSDA
jgi:hypothetical protein